MGKDVKENIEFWLSIIPSFREAIYKLRKWSHLKVANEDNLIWVRGFTKSEIESTSILKIPSAMRYYLKNAQLVPYGKFLPSTIEPSLLWTPIQRGLRITLPKENFHYFGISQVHKISLIPSNDVRPTNAIIVQLQTLESYISTAYYIRLKNLKWTILDSNRALILGAPLLPIKSQDFYQNGCFLIPAGWKIRFDNMTKVYKRALGESAEYWYLLKEENELSKLRKSDFNQLSKGSFIKTLP